MLGQRLSRGRQDGVDLDVGRGEPVTARRAGPGRRVMKWVKRNPAVAGLIAGLALVLLGPTLLVGLLHLALPRDCPSGRTETGDCSRDREMR